MPKGHEPAVPFKKLPVTIRERLHELTPYEFVTWTVHFTSANMEGISYPSRQTICAYTALHRDTVSKATAGLIRKRWLLPAGFARTKDGRLSGIKRYEPVIPDVGPEPATVVTRRRLPTGSGLNRTDDGSHQHTDDGSKPSQKKIHGSREGKEKGISPPSSEGQKRVPRTAWDWYAEQLLDEVGLGNAPANIEAVKAAMVSVAEQLSRSSGRRPRPSTAKTWLGVRIRDARFSGEQITRQWFEAVGEETKVANGPTP